MTGVKLRRLLTRDRPAALLLEALVAALGAEIGIQSPDGALLFGRPADRSHSRVPVECNGETIGWVVGDQQAKLVAGLLAHLAAKESENQALADETLNLYREISLLHDLSQKLAGALEPHGVASATLDEASRVIKASAGAVMLNDEQAEALTVIAWFGKGLPDLALKRNTGIIAQVMGSAKAEIVNEVRADPRHSEAEAAFGSLLCAPLRVKGRMLGAILLGSADPMPYTAGDLKLLTTLASQAAVAIENARLAQLAVEQARLERELQLARAVQASLLPRTLPAIPGWEFAAWWQPAREVAGDYYDFFPVDKGRLGLVIADVADKGMPAALFMALTRSTIRGTVARALSPADCITRANQLLSADSTDGTFVTLVYAQLDPAQSAVSYVNAGHDPPFLYRAQSDELVTLERTGMVLGLVSYSRFAERTVRLAPGDFIALYTDGVTDARDVEKHEFGEGNLCRVLRERRRASAREIAAALEEALREHIGAGVPYDDSTVVVAKCL